MLPSAAFPHVQGSEQIWVAVGQWATNEIWMQPLMDRGVTLCIPSPYGQPRSLAVGHFEVTPHPPLESKNYLKNKIEI
jgi:hypothetical protein